MLLCLPYSLGGYGLPHPTMNAEMPLPKNVAATGRSSLRCDLYWPAVRLDVEYDSAGSTPRSACLRTTRCDA